MIREVNIHATVSPTTPAHVRKMFCSVKKHIIEQKKTNVKLLNYSGGG